MNTSTLMHNNIEFNLSPCILKGIPFDRYEQNFAFIVNGKEFRTSRFLADLISPTIRQYHSTDETLDEFTLDLKEDNTNLTFSDFLKIISFEKVEITQEQLQYYTKILFLLGNREIITKSFPFMNEDITLNNVFDRILYKEKYFQQESKTKEQEKESIEDDKLLDIPKELLQEEVDFLSTHFTEIDQDQLKNLRISLIESVISNPLLLLDNEDSLFRFIASLYSENSSLSYLFENVDFLNISDDCIEQFYENFDLNDINHSIWSEIIKRSISTQKVTHKHKHKEEKRRKEEEQQQEKQQHLQQEQQQHVQLNNEQNDDHNYYLNVILPNGRNLVFNCNPTDLVQDVLNFASEQVYIEPDQLVVVNEGRLLERDQPFNFYNLPRGARLSIFNTLN